MFASCALGVWFQSGHGEVFYLAFKTEIKRTIVFFVAKKAVVSNDFRMRTLTDAAIVRCFIRNTWVDGLLNLGARTLCTDSW